MNWRSITCKVTKISYLILFELFIASSSGVLLKGAPLAV